MTGKDLLLKVSLKVEEEADSFHELRIYLDLHIPASANSSLQNHLEVIHGKMLLAFRKNNYLCFLIRIKGEEENSSSKVE